EILTLDVSPGQHLDESDLAALCRMLRSPVREVIIRLAAEPLLVPLSNRRTQLASLHPVAFPNDTEALDLLQRANTRLAAHYRTDADITAIRREMMAFEVAVKHNDYLEMSQTNLQFHVAVARAGRNPYLTAQYERLLGEGRR